MNFFEHQDQARKNTRRLIAFFSLAVLSLIAITTVFVAGFLYYFDSQNQKRFEPLQAMDGGNASQLLQLMSWELVAGIAAAVICVVLIGSLYKLSQLSGGGEKVAASLGGKRLQPNTTDANERKLQNVVEEMAIASGTPVPPVFIMEEASINAFAAGYDANDAVIGVTRGCMELLNREELQGVIAHEFSHILHGDMRINIRLIGILHGILIIGLLGSLLMRSGAYSSAGYRHRSSSRSKEGAGIALLGLGFIIIGYAGTFFGKLIKSAVSRQREFLADASAVQFTRDPSGISSALQKIGGYSEGSKIHHANAEEFSHMYFGEGIASSFSNMMATHPPLPTRIERIQPNWSGQFPNVDAQLSAASNASAGNTEERTSSFAGTHSAAPISAAAPVESVQSSTDVLNTSTLDDIGNPRPEHVQKAQQLLQQIPDALKDAAHDPFAARAIVYNLLIQIDTSAQQQWQQLKQRAHPVVYKHTLALHKQVQQLPRNEKLPLLEICIPALKTLSDPQHKVFKENVVALIKADKKVDIFEWSLYRILLNSLEPQADSSQRAALKHLAVPCQQLVSTLATAGHDNEKSAGDAYHQAMSQLGFANLPLLGDGNISLPMLDSAIKQLQRLKPLQKPALLKALMACIKHDGKVTTEEYELFRAIAECLNCPVPPLLD
ncbi:MAG: peptidase [Cellvibrionaceae bacterium]|nr:peptidase [Cellvibrionaceae bacterium]|tara:strand:- start:45362 stop:47356 length:1995 start_codon:yes stop_codon:yes gene_type:complete